VGGDAGHRRRPACGASLDDLRESFARLFGHTARGRVPPYETEYGSDSLFLPVVEMADLAAFYRGFGLRVAPGGHERPDHASCQCEFLAFLTRKEAYALARRDGEMRDVTRAAARRFLRDHLGRWGPTLGRALAREDPAGFFGAVGRLAVELVTRDCARVGVPAGPEFLPLRTRDRRRRPCRLRWPGRHPRAPGPRVSGRP
jgi:TorA maturation chaperone TorD